MSSAITAQDVFRDIEFELLQGAIRQDDLGQGIQSVREYHNHLRTDLFAAVKDSEASREIVARQTQFNDMLLTVVQEMGNELLQVRNQQRSLGNWLPQQDLPARSAETAEQASARTADVNLYQADATPAMMNLWRSTDADVVSMMRSEALSLSLSTRPVPIPVVGWFLHKIRTALHNLSLFYVRALASRQIEVNRIYGERLLALSQTNRHYQIQIDELRAEIQRLQTESHHQA